MQTDLFEDDRKRMWNGGNGMRDWVGREGEEWEGPEKGCVLDYMGLALWVGVGGSRGWTEMRLVSEGFAMERRICVSGREDGKYGSVVGT